MNAKVDTSVIDQVASERELLGAILLDPALSSHPSIAVIEPQFFIDPAHQAIFREFKSMKEDGRPVDLLTFSMFVRGNGASDECGGTQYIRGIVDRVCTSAHAVYHAELLIDAVRRRELSAVALQIAAKAEGGGDPSSLCTEAETLLRSVAERVRPRNEIRLYSGAELDQSEFKIEYLVDQVLVKGQPCIFAAPQKALKTTIAIDCALSMATSTPFLGQFFARRATTIFFSGESGLATLQETARRICESKGTTLANADRFILTDWLPRFDDAGSMQQLRRIIREREANVVMIDPAYLCIPGDDAGNLFKMGSMLRQLTDVASETGITPILIHHTKKSANINDAYAIPELSGIAWSGFAEYARQWILLNRRGQYEPGTGDHRLWLAYGGSAGHSGAWGLDVFEGTPETIGGRVWQVRLAPANQIRHEQQKEVLAAKEEKRDNAKRIREDQIDGKVLKSLSTDEFLTAGAIRTATGLNSTNTSASLQRLIESGRVETEKTLVNGRACDGYRLSIGQHWTALDSPEQSNGGSIGQGLAPIGGSPVQSNGYLVVGSDADGETYNGPMSNGHLDSEPRSMAVGEWGGF